MLSPIFPAVSQTSPVPQSAAETHSIARFGIAQVQEHVEEFEQVALGVLHTPGAF